MVKKDVIKEDEIKDSEMKEDKKDVDERLDEDDLAMMGGGQPSRGKGTGSIAVVLISLMLVIAGGIAGVVLLGMNMEDAEKENEGGVVADIASEDSGYDGTPFIFRASLENIDIEEVDVLWDFGDGQGGAGAVVEHVYGSVGTYTVTLTIEKDGEVMLSAKKNVTVAPASGPVKGLLPDGRIPDWSFNFTGDCGEGTLTLLDIVISPDIIMRINLTLGEVVRSFVGVELMDVFDLAGIRFDADGYTVNGDGSYSSDVFTTIKLERHGGNGTYLIMVEDGQWLSGTDVDSTFMLVGPGGEVVTNVHSIDISALELEITGKGVPEAMALTLDEMFDLFKLEKYNVSDGKELHTFLGYPVWPILELANILRNATEVTFQARDGYSTSFNVNYVYDNPEAKDPFFLSIRRGEEYHERTRGPFMLVTPDDDLLVNPVQPWFKAFWVKQVSRIIVDASDEPAPDLPWGEPVDAVINITWEDGWTSFTTSELASHFDLLVTVECTKVRSVGDATTDVYTGIPLTDLLELARAPQIHGDLDLKASDGYTRSIDPWTIYRAEQEGNLTLVALAEGGEWLSEEDGGLMIASSALEGNYWISMLSGVHVNEWALEVGDLEVSLSELRSSASTYSGNASKLKGDNTTTNITASGIIVYELLDAHLNLSGMGNVTFFSVDGMTLTLSLSDLETRSAWNVSAFLAWEIDDQVLNYYSGLMRLILPDDMVNGDDWTSNLWLKWVCRIEVTP